VDECLADLFSISKLSWKIKISVVKHHMMKAYRGSEGKAIHTLKF
jgi:hypothetical protein